MKVSRNWLQKYFDAELPSVAELSEALTFHAFEIEESTEDMLDVKVLPDRAAYGLSHRGIAKEISAILNIPLKEDPLRTELPAFAKSETLSVSIHDERCSRYIGARVNGVKVGPSPAWLKEALESVGQRSINNVVDATNYVMLNVGQPLHAFDAKLLGGSGVGVRAALAGEKITTLSGDDYVLPEGTLVIVDGEDAPVGIAGIKGGKKALVSEATTELVLESANFDGSSVRKTAQALKLFTDASMRFQNRVAPELAAYGMRDLIRLVQEIAGGTLEGVIDEYPNKNEEATSVSFTVGTINGKLGADFSKEEIEGVLNRLGLSYVQEGSAFTVTSPWERRDIQMPEDLVEEIGRILGYDRVPASELPPSEGAPDLARYRGIERVKDILTERGFTEISTPSFFGSGEIMLANPLQEEKPYLRADLAGNMRDALTRAVFNAPRVLGPVPDVRLFELGTVFAKDGERLSLALGYAPVSGKKQKVLEEVAVELGALLNLSLSSADSVLEVPLGEADLEKLGEGYEPREVALEKYKEFSLFPFALRDVAVWTPSGTEESEVIAVILKEAGEHVARIDLFDRFEKEGRTSYAFRLVFESFTKTLSDEELVPAMGRVTAALNAKEGWQVR